MTGLSPISVSVEFRNERRRQQQQQLRLCSPLLPFPFRIMTSHCRVVMATVWPSIDYRRSHEVERERERESGGTTILFPPHQATLSHSFHSRGGESIEKLLSR